MVDTGLQTLSSPGLSRDGSVGTLTTPFPCYGPGMLLGGHCLCPQPPLPHPCPLPPCTPLSLPAGHSVSVSMCVHACTCALVGTPRGIGPRGRGGRGPPGPEELSSQRKPPRRGEAGWGSGNQSCPSRLCPPPGPGPHGRLDGDLLSPAPRGRTQALSSGRVWWAPARGRTGLPPACRPGLTITAKSARETPEGAGT